MLARFVQVSPEELADLVADPSAVPDLVEEADDLPVGMLTLSDTQLADATGGTHGSALLELMVRRGLVPSDDEPGDMLETAERRTLSLDKAWHGIHYLLSGRPEPHLDRWGRVILGGTEIGEDDFGYGPARYFDADEVAEISADLGRPELEAELEDRFDPTRMTALAIYPGGWRSGDCEWVLDGFRQLRGFLADASARGAAVVTCLV